MSEKINHNQETSNTPERTAGSDERLAEHHEARARNSKHEHKDNIEQILGRIDKVARSKHESGHTTKTDERPDKPEETVFAGAQLKDTTLKRTLKGVRKDLKPYERPFSRFLHNNAVEKISETSAKTIARPNGLLFGGIASLLTSLVIFFICRYYGYEYNYFIGLVSFPAGFLIGLLGELITQPLRHRR